MFFPDNNMEVRCCECTCFERQNIDTGPTIAYCNDQTFSIRTFPFSAFEIVSSPMGLIDPELPRPCDLMKSHRVSSESIACNHRQLVIENVPWPRGRRIMFLTQRRELQFMSYSVIVQLTKPRWIDFPTFQVERDFMTQSVPVDSRLAGWDELNVRSNERAQQWRQMLDQQASTTGPTVGTCFACLLGESDDCPTDRFALELVDRLSESTWNATLYSVSEIPVSRTGVHGQRVMISGRDFYHNDSVVLKMPPFEFACITDVATEPL